MKYLKRNFLCIILIISLLFLQSGICMAINVDTSKIIPSENGVYTVEFNEAIAGRTYSIAVLNEFYEEDSDAQITENNLVYATQIEAKSTTISKEIYISGIGEKIYTVVIGDSIGSDLIIVGYLTEHNIVPVTGVSINYSKITIAKGSQISLTAQVMPENASNKTVSWSSDNNQIAVVDNEGVVSGMSNGTTNITVTTDDGNHTSVCAVTVNDTGIDYSAPLIEIGDASGEIDDYVRVDVSLKNNTGLTDLKFNIKFDNTILTLDKVENGSVFASYSPSIIPYKASTYTVDCSEDTTVTQSGCIVSLYFYVDGGEIGQNYPITGTIINAKNNTENISMPIINGRFDYVEKGPISVENIEVNPTEAEISVGDILQIEATVTPDDASDKSIRWSSNQESVAQVDSNGLVRGLSAGEATIIATTNDKELKARTRVIVKESKHIPVPVTDVKISTSSVTITKGEATILMATVIPSSADNKTVSWSSDNPHIADVDDLGIVKAVSEGIAHITVTTQDGNHTASCLVTVEKAITEPEITPEPGRDKEPDSNPEPDENSSIITVGTVSAVAGQIVKIPVYISNNNAGISALDLSIYYDQNLKLVSAEESDEINGDVVFTTSGSNDVYPYHLMFEWQENYCKDSKIAILTFEVPKGITVGSYNVKAYYSERDAFRFSGNGSTFEYFNPEVMQGKINVLTYKPGDINGDGSVDHLDVTALRQYIAGGYNVQVIDAALDIDGDENPKGKPTISDVVRLRMNIVDDVYVD